MSVPTETVFSKAACWRRKIRALFTGRRVVLVLGDSHAEIFDSPELRRELNGLDFELCTVRGATASGLDNPNSKTQAYTLFSRALSTSRADAVVVLLGEVDTGFVLWYRAQKYQEPVDETLSKAVKTYGDFLRALTARREVVCISAPLPTIPDGAAQGIVANLRSEIRATQRERTELTRRFNGEIAVVCEAAGIHHIDLDVASTGPDGLVDRRLLNTDPTNHHYAIAPYAAMLAGPLGTALAARRRAG
jgi:hypothetical protein